MSPLPQWAKSRSLGQDSPKKRRVLGSNSPVKRRVNESNPGDDGGLIPWVASIFSDNACCSMRERLFEGVLAPAPRRPPAARRDLVKSGMQMPNFPSPNAGDSVPFHRATPASDLPADFFQNLARQTVNDPQVAAKIADDPNSHLIWGDAKSFRVLFLQMCIRDRYERCRDLWWQLQECDRRAFRAVYQHGPTSPDFFSNVFLHGDAPDCSLSREGVWREMTDTSDTGREWHGHLA